MTIQTKLPTALWPDLPRDHPMIDKDGMMSDVWKLFFDQLILALQTNLKPEGFVIPQQTTSNINLLTATQSIANIIYDSTVPVFKGNVAGTWKTFTFT